MLQLHHLCQIPSCFPRKILFPWMLLVLLQLPFAMLQLHHLCQIPSCFPRKILFPWMLLVLLRTCLPGLVAPEILFPCSRGSSVSARLGCPGLGGVSCYAPCHCRQSAGCVADMVAMV